MMHDTDCQLARQLGDFLALDGPAVVFVPRSGDAD